MHEIEIDSRLLSLIRKCDKTQIYGQLRVAREDRSEIKKDVFSSEVLTNVNNSRKTT